MICQASILMLTVSLLDRRSETSRLLYLQNMNGYYLFVSLTSHEGNVVRALSLVHAWALNWDCVR